MDLGLNVFPKEMFSVWLPGFKSRVGWFTQLFIPNGYNCPECECMSIPLVYSPSRHTECLSICKWQLMPFFTA